MSQAFAAASVFVSGASEGVGEAVAFELVQRGFRVFAGVSTKADAERFRKQSSSLLTPIVLDVTQKESIAAAVRVVKDEFGETELWGLVNNAPVAVPCPLEIASLDAWRRQFEINVLGQVAVIQAFLPFLRKTAGRIVNIGSKSDLAASPFMGLPVASNFAIGAISDTLRLELRPWSIHVSAVETDPARTSAAWTRVAPPYAAFQGESLAEKQSLYQNYLALFEAVKNNKQSAQSATPDRILRAVVHALTVDHPKTHYRVDRREWFSFRGVGRLLPLRLRAWSLRKKLSWT